MRRYLAIGVIVIGAALILLGIFTSKKESAIDMAVVKLKAGDTVFITNGQQFIDTGIRFKVHIPESTNKIKTLKMEVGIDFDSSIIFSKWDDTLNKWTIISKH